MQWGHGGPSHFCHREEPRLHRGDLAISAFPVTASRRRGSLIVEDKRWDCCVPMQSGLAMTFWVPSPSRGEGQGERDLRTGLKTCPYEIMVARWK